MNITGTVLELAHECSEFLKYDWGVKWDTVLLVSLIAVVHYKVQRDLQRVVQRVSGKGPEASGPPVSGNLTPEHQRDLGKLIELVSEGGRSGGSQNEWLMKKIESLENEIQTLRGRQQVNPSRPQEAPASVSVAPVEGQRWERVSSRLERMEEVEEDPGEGPSPKPPRKATQKTNRHGEDSDDEGQRWERVPSRLDRMERKQDNMQKSWSAARNHSEPVAVSAIRRKRTPVRVKDRSEPMSRGAMWNYLRDHGEDMRKWHDKPNFALRARVRELQKRSATTEVASTAADNQ
ncbi:uncharacterized protein LOC107308525 [Coturnix japonica]|uniref:uncharacterized protein LOC107308525 n=1 Tax=Coturnix japonica TaxID=93934 RepID=UPI000776BEF1|nr:uncharacterized protein LOC107308525 [Coturnix japonica]